MRPAPKRKGTTPLPFRNPFHLRQKPAPSRIRGGAAARPAAKFSPEKPPRNMWERITRRKFKFTWKKFFISLGVLLGVFVIALAGIFAYYAPQLPNPKSLTNRVIPQSTKVLDRNGTLLFDMHGDQNRTIVTGDQISPFLKDATVAIEDNTFFKNHGFDLKGIARAALVRMHLLKGELAGGGSTITQQYVKNALLTGSSGKAEDSLSRKLKELILSVEVEQNYSKDTILTGYLNQIPYGNSAYGIEEASRTYFNKSAKDLTLSEAATLAAVPNAPTYYSPYGNHLDELFARKDYILGQMVRGGFITQAQADQAKKDAPSMDNPDFKSGTNQVAPHFVNYIREQLISYIGGDPELAEQKLDEAGYTVTTSLDIPTQNLAQSVVSKDAPPLISKWNATNAGLVAVDPKTGEILAMVGSVDYNASKAGQVNFMNSPLNPGSTFKPIVYATAWNPDHTFSPSSITYDLVTDFGGNYKPTDYNGGCEYCGPVTDRQALDGSLNISAVKNIALVTVPAAIKTAQDLGITTLTRSATEYGLPLVLGSGEVKPVEMANAYAAFANGGMHNPLRPILTITKGSTMVKDFRTTPATKAIEPEVAYEMSNVLSDDSARAKIFGAHGVLTLPDRPVAAKTGTTQNNRDGWTVGYTPSIVTAVWIGNNDPGKFMKAGADGSYVAAPIWNDFMKQYLKGKPVEQFSRPDTVKDVQVDKLSGKLPTDQTPNDSKITDIFAPWQIPKTKDDVHVKVRIDSVSGKLATDLTPLNTVIEQYFFNVHSEMPNNPNWEGPVQAWARANGGGTNPPTASDDVHTSDNLPTVNFVSPTTGLSTSASTLHIEIAPGGVKPVTQATFSLNGQLIATRTTAPWSVDQDISSLSAGTQTISATVTNSIGLTQTQQITFQTVADTTAPGPVTGVSSSNGKLSNNTPITLSWTNPTTTDLASVNVYESTSSDPVDLGSLIKNVGATPGSPGTVSVSVTGLTPGTYYFVIRSVDGHGNEDKSTSKVSATVH